MFVGEPVRNIATRSNRDRNIPWHRLETEDFGSTRKPDAHALVKKHASRRG